MNLFSLVVFSKKILATCIENSLVDEYAWRIIMHVFRKTKGELLTAPPEITPDIKSQIEQILTDITVNHKPIQYILKTMPFLELELTIEPPILICRPETEQLCHTIISMLTPYKQEPLLFLDIGTGSGCIALSFAKAFPKATVYAVDISPIALTLATHNAEKNNIGNIMFIQSDLFSHIDPTISFDLIISNPPYIAKNEWENLEPSVKDWEDIGALVANDNGFSILSAIIKKARGHLNTKSSLRQSHMPQLVLEIGYTQGERVKNMMHRETFSKVTVWQDQYNKDRAVFGSL